jgi:hypothetical protein
MEIYIPQKRPLIKPQTRISSGLDKIGFIIINPLALDATSEAPEEKAIYIDNFLKNY